MNNQMLCYSSLTEVITNIAEMVNAKKKKHYHLSLDYHLSIFHIICQFSASYSII